MHLNPAAPGENQPRPARHTHQALPSVAPSLPASLTPSALPAPLPPPPRRASISVHFLVALSPGVDYHGT